MLSMYEKYRGSDNYVKSCRFKEEEEYEKN
jgi:hypothetical protein